DEAVRGDDVAPLQRYHAIEASVKIHQVHRHAIGRGEISLLLHDGGHGQLPDPCHLNRFLVLSKTQLAKHRHEASGSHTGKDSTPRMSHLSFPTLKSFNLLYQPSNS